MAEASEIRLICLDLDGTALDFDEHHVWLADGLVELLNHLGRRGVMWCTNSGRNHQNQLGLVQACRWLDHMPVALLAAERSIYWLRPSYRPCEPFNSMMAERMHDLHPRVMDAIAPHRQLLRDRYGFNYELDNDLVFGWNLVDESEAPAFMGELGDLLAGVRDAQILRNGTWVVITHTTAGKGVVLKETARHLGLARENILAIGDHLNDLDMLDGRTAAHVGCPVDADETVTQAVRAAGGIISDLPHAQGTADII